MAVLQIPENGTMEFVRAALGDGIELAGGARAKLGIVVIGQDRHFRNGVLDNIDLFAGEIRGIVVNAVDVEGVSVRPRAAYGPAISGDASALGHDIRRK